MLKQAGSGSVSSGVCAATRDPSVQYSICNTLRVEKATLQTELARLPQSNAGAAEMDLAKMYSRLSARKSSAASGKAGSSVPQDQSIFHWCVCNKCLSWPGAPCSAVCCGKSVLICARQRLHCITCWCARICCLPAGLHDHIETLM